MAKKTVIQNFATKKKVENKFPVKVYTVEQLAKMPFEEFKKAKKEIKAGKARAIA